MGRQEVTRDTAPAELRAFTKALLNDLRALEMMLHDHAFESGISRVGAEQELFLVNRGFRPAPVAQAVLESLTGSEFVTELALFNLEINLPPFELSGGCFGELERALGDSIERVRQAAALHRAEPVLVGILPTLNMSDLTLANITPRDRYYALNDALTRMSGGSYEIHMQGVDELHIQHDSVMLEGCNTSFQVHLQVDADDFPRVYNVAQAMTAPLLAASVNSPLLFGKRLWAETRIALFHQAMWTGRTTAHVRELTSRVRFGDRWVRNSVLDVFKEDIARIPALLGTEIEEDPVRELREGRVPKLSALQLYNGTVYRWNRPCYGVFAGKPHLRIECRVLPSGPTVLDEVANAVFWVGLVRGGVERYGDITERLGFDDTRANLVAAARLGLKAGFAWLDGKTEAAPALILDQLLPLARDGLLSAGVAAGDVDRYLGVIEKRVETQATGARWLERSLMKLGTSGTRAERMAALTAAVARRQQDGKPCHEWDLAEISEGGGWRHHYLQVEQVMTTDLFTVQEDELVDLAAFLMDSRNVRQVPVEDDERRLVGLVSYGAVLRQLAVEPRSEDDYAIPVKAIMESNPVSVTPETATVDAIGLMREHNVTCLPVVKGERLVGIVSVGDFMPIAERLLQERIGEEL